MISIAPSDDKCQITAVVVTSMSGECIPIQLLYQGKTVRCHPKVSPRKFGCVAQYKPLVKRGDDDQVYKGHCSRCFFKKRSTETGPCLSCSYLFKENNIVAIRVLSNCTDKLQPIVVSVNKPIKDMMRRKFQTWYASKVAEQLKEV